VEGRREVFTFDLAISSRLALTLIFVAWPPRGVSGLGGVGTGGPSE
jgi:hypothetical protein